MSLAEYRRLVERAVRHDLHAKKRKLELPPVRYAVNHVVYHGQVQRAGKAEVWSARFTAKFSLTLTTDKWVRCDLGPLLPGAARATASSSAAPSGR